jgi:hypothetical protein
MWQLSGSHPDIPFKKIGDITKEGETYSWPPNNATATKI